MSSPPQSSSTLCSNARIKRALWFAYSLEEVKAHQGRQLESLFYLVHCLLERLVKNCVSQHQDNVV